VSETGFAQGLYAVTVAWGRGSDFYSTRSMVRPLTQTFNLILVDEKRTGYTPRAAGTLVVEV